MSFTGSIVHIYVIISIDMDPEGIGELSCLSMFLLVFPNSYQIYSHARTHIAISHTP